MITKVQITDNSRLPLKYAKELDAFKNGNLTECTAYIE